MQGGDSANCGEERDDGEEASVRFPAARPTLKRQREAQSILEETLRANRAGVSARARGVSAPSLQGGASRITESSPARTDEGGISTVRRADEAEGVIASCLSRRHGHVHDLRREDPAR